MSPPDNGPARLIDFGIPRHRNRSPEGACPGPAVSDFPDRYRQCGYSACTSALQHPARFPGAFRPLYRLTVGLDLQARLLLGFLCHQRAERSQYQQTHHHMLPAAFRKYPFAPRNHPFLLSMRKLPLCHYLTTHSFIFQEKPALGPKNCKAAALKKVTGSWNIF